NVSVRKPGGPLGTRCEIKNVNSMRFIRQAIEYEARRQIEIIEEGGAIRQETRLYDQVKGETRSMRSKEESHDYRYFPDPDLLPLEFSQEWVDKIAESLPELPDAKKARFMSAYGLSAYDASILVSERETAEYFEQVAKGRDAKIAANWVITNLYGALKEAGKTIETSPVSSEALGRLLDLLADQTLSSRLAKDVFEIMLSTGDDPEKIVEERGLRQVTDTGAIDAAIDAVMAANPDKVAEVKSGKDKLLGWFVGQVMKSTGGKANPQMLNDALRQKFGL
ncbi:MAG: Asp-tRNA(Asn)/Glu-tRNA(Gln) amidotransferase GatCAB subunit B, partial [Alphaproteobacteria bacterium]|nr:Asp-tRNA(Asn)/Glu-tRNA(Gln) amidotransferase GatCAB subunit B [Alphaproteobacteria bacterium]